MAKKDKKSYIDKDVFIKAVLDFDYSPEKAAEYLAKLGHQINKYNVQYRIDRLISKGKLPLRSGNTPEAGLLLKKASTMYGPDGEVKLQWITSERGKEDLLKAFAEAVANITESVTPKKPVKMPKSVMSNLLSVYTIGDAHVGMLSWKPESGEDNDLLTAQHRHIVAMQMLVAQANPTKEAFIVDVGDYFHADNADNRTAKSGNVLDVDGRFAKVLEIGLILTTMLIDLALEKHETVRWRSAIGE
jgi:hypothetical protein